MKFIDSHCHLDRLELPEGVTLEQVMNEARARGVCHFLNIGVEQDSFPQVLAIAEAHADVSCSVGTHPLYEGIHETNFDWVRSAANHCKVVAIGETGLDYYYKPESAEAQQRSFRAHIRLARELGLPLIVHTRQAQTDTLNLLKEEGASEFGGVLHCFTEDWPMAAAALELGFYISLSGIVTFRNADSLREVARNVPPDRLLIETDAPWLAPVPYRGKSNLPAYVVEVAQCIARERGISLDALAAQTTANFCQLFRRADVAI
ncbi:TatD family hydrolase [Permianibacter fluminis]|uniref:TatD family hydrolase n=1 Tax=Permianibacter fluminis TaxID=2738515 RepID=UPI002E29CED7|nr:TatD family hydrolase [Permianibacter fluminis]